MSAHLDTSAATRRAYQALAADAHARAEIGEARGYEVLIRLVTPPAPHPVLPAMPADKGRAYRIAEARDRAAFEAAFAVPVEVLP